MMKICPRCRSRSLEVFKTHSICYECNLSSVDMGEETYYYPMSSVLRANLKRAEAFLDSLSSEVQGEDAGESKNESEEDSQKIPTPLRVSKASVHQGVAESQSSEISLEPAIFSSLLDKRSCFIGSVFYPKESYGEPHQTQSVQSQSLSSLEKYRVREYVSLLPPIHQEVVLLRFWSLFSVGEIAEKLDLGWSETYEVLENALKILKILMSHESWSFKK